MGRCREDSGTWGKYDNVRRLWEDRVTGHVLRPHLERLVKDKRRRGKGLRILDLGCGAGDGLDLIRGIPGAEEAPDGSWSSLVSETALGEYIGVDINEDLLAQARLCHAGDGKARFVCADLSAGLPPEITDGCAPFDLYFSSYAMLSHFRDEQCVRLLADICRHAGDDALFVGDWLGHYSYEWQDLWQEPAGPDSFIDYRMSYLYSQAEHAGVDIPTFPLRLMTRETILDAVHEASRQSGREVAPLAIFDRSILTGRHSDTREYNRGCPPLRSMVNSLLEPHLRTDLERLLVKYSPRDGFDRLNRFFAEFFAASNEVVTRVIQVVGGDNLGGQETWITSRGSESLRLRLEAVLAVARELAADDSGYARANLLEPMLAHALRRLEMEFQEGIGAGHSMGAIIGIGDRRSPWRPAL